MSIRVTPTTTRVEGIDMVNIYTKPEVRVIALVTKTIIIAAERDNTVVSSFKVVKIRPSWILSNL